MAAPASNCSRSDDAAVGGICTKNQSDPFWVSFLPDAYRKLRPDGIWIHQLPYWSNALSAEVGRHRGDLLIKYDPRDVSRIFIQHPVSGHFIEARARNLGFLRSACANGGWPEKRRDRRAGESVTTTSSCERRWPNAKLSPMRSPRRRRRGKLPHGQK